MVFDEDKVSATITISHYIKTTYECINEDKVSATISINNYIKTTYAHLLFQMEKDFKKMKPVRSERRKCVSHHYHK